MVIALFLGVASAETLAEKLNEMEIAKEYLDTERFLKHFSEAQELKSDL